MLASMQRRQVKFGTLLLIPVAFLAKDIIATIAVLSQEPGISERAVLYYAIALLPGTLFVTTGSAMLLNSLIGLAISIIIFVVQKLRPRRLP